MTAITAEQSNSNAPRGRNNRPVALILVVLVAGMVGLSFAAVPLYQLFCQVTGFAGTTQRATAAGGTIDRIVGVRFDANVTGGLPIRVVPATRVEDRIGAVETVTYRATNLTNREITTTASFNVVPESAGIYFNKMECFCFTEQTLAPGETVDMPVTFFVDPELDGDRDLRTLKDITLSYTFYPVAAGRS